MKTGIGFKKEIPLLVLVLPGLVCLLIFNYMPMFAAIVAFKNFNYVDGFFRSPWSGFENFKYLFQLDAYYITRNTVGYNLVFIFLGLVVSVAIAIMLNELRNKRLAKLYQSLMFFPSLISWVIISYAVYAFLSIDKGFINNILQNVFKVEPVEWYAEVNYWPFIIIFMNLWRSAGYGAVIYLANIVSIDPEYYESAVLDGAGKWQQIRYITIPMLTPTIIILTLLNLGRIFYADTGLFYQVPRNTGVLYPVTNVIDTYVLNGLRGQGQLGMTAAASLYQSFVGFILVLLSNSFVRRISRENSLF
jgi:putative aldouronate transport system permease protein